MVPNKNEAVDGTGYDLLCFLSQKFVGFCGLYVTRRLRMLFDISVRTSCILLCSLINSSVYAKTKMCHDL